MDTASGPGMTSAGSTAGPTCGPNPCGACGPGCENVDECIDGQWSCQCACSDDGSEDDGPPPDPCPSLETEIVQWASMSKAPPVDCGEVGPGDELEAWQGVQTCVLDRLAAGEAFYARWGDPKDEPDPYELGAAARQGARYEFAWFEVSGFYTHIQYACQSIEVIPECTVAVGDPCLRCSEQEQVTVHCDLK